MATWSLRRFSCPEVLKSIKPEHLIAFLKPHRRFFISRGVSLPSPNSSDEIDYQALVKVFLSPDGKTPKELIDALYFVDELATPQGMDALLDEADRLSLDWTMATTTHRPTWRYRYGSSTRTSWSASTPRATWRRSGRSNTTRWVVTDAGVQAPDRQAARCARERSRRLV